MSSRSARFTPSLPMEHGWVRMIAGPACSNPGTWNAGQDVACQRRPTRLHLVRRSSDVELAW
jgi:hypothetical protein